MTDKRTFWEAEEIKLEERRQEAIGTGGQKAVDTLAKREIGRASCRERV